LHLLDLCERVAPAGCKSCNAFEVIIVGGGPAGLQAALTLGRAMKRTLLMDAGEPRNWMVQHFHNFLGHDGENPTEFKRATKKDIEGKYGEFVKFLDDQVEDVTGQKGDFILSTKDGEQFKASRILLALGVQDQLPEHPPVYAKQYYKSIFSCPFCHGIEARQKKIAVVSSSTLNHLIMMR
jgi:thioredoxin reductase